MALLDRLNKRKKNKGDNAEMSFVDHLEELRGVIIHSLVACLIGALIVGSFHKIFFDKVIMAPATGNFITYQFMCKAGNAVGLDSALCIQPYEIRLQSTTVTGQFNMAFSFSFVAGFVLAFPFIFWKFWRFVKPALSENEKKGVSGVIFWVSLLFFLGIGFGYFFLAPYAFNFFASFSLSSQIDNKPSVQDYLDMLLTFTLGCGLAFQLPIVLYFLGKIGVVTATFLKKYFRHAVAVIAIIAAIITPPDGLTMVIVGLPLVLLYWISIGLVARINKAAKLKEAEWE